MAVASAPVTTRRGSAEQVRAVRADARRTYLESGIVFLLFGAVYLVVGLYVVTKQNVVVFDALARMAHGYFVWHNDPPKLAAIGFVWPPMQSLAYLPFTAVKSLGTSLAAMPLCSAAFMAALVVVLNRMLTFSEMRWWQRYTLLIAFGLNPMIVFYGSNGMAEPVYLFFLTVGVFFFIRWYVTRQAHLLAICGLSIGLALLGRYEVSLYAVGIGLGVLFALALRKATIAKLEGSLLLYAAPIAYAVGAWLFFGWLILGDPLYFTTFGSPDQADISATAAAVATPGVPLDTTRSLGEVAHWILEVNFALMPLAVLLLLVLFVNWLMRRDFLSLLLIGLLSTNAIFTFLAMGRGGAEGLLQLRYNMRAMPLAILALGWIFYSMRGRFTRFATWALALVALLAGIPVTWTAMKVYRHQYEESAFVRALEGEGDQEGTTAIGGYPIGIAGEQKMADFITEKLPDRKNSILTDDAQSLGVMLLSGRPDLFADRIDRGQEVWRGLRDRPFGAVDYILVASDKRCREGACSDLVRARYPGIVRGKVPWAREIYRTDLFVLFEVVDGVPINDRPT